MTMTRIRPIKAATNGKPKTRELALPTGVPMLACIAQPAIDQFCEMNIENSLQGVPGEHLDHAEALEFLECVSDMLGAAHRADEIARIARSRA